MTLSDKPTDAEMVDMGLSQSQPCGASKHAATDLNELMEIARKAAKRAPGEWSTDLEKGDGEYGTAPDSHAGFNVPVLFAGDKRVLDAHTSDIAEIMEESGGDEDGDWHTAWDDASADVFEFIVAAQPTAFISLLERLQAAEQNAANRLADVEALEESAREDAAALSTSEASRLSVEGERDELRGEYLRAIDHLQSWVDDHHDEATTETWAIFHCAEKIRHDSTRSQDPGPHPCGSQLEPASMQGAPLTGSAVLPLDDPSRPFSDSLLPEAMIYAGMEALDRAADDLAGRNGKNVPDWDTGMEAVAVWRAMSAAALRYSHPHPCGEQPGADVAATAAVAPRRENKKAPGGCQLHNIHCGYPKCDVFPLTSKGGE